MVSEGVGSRLRRAVIRVEGCCRNQLPTPVAAQPSANGEAPILAEGDDDVRQCRQEHEDHQPQAGENRNGQAAGATLLGGLA